MLTAWVPNTKGLHRHDGGGCASPVQAVWLDAADITKEEEDLVEGVVGIDIPTRAEMQEIEASSRLYREGDALVMTATLLVKTETQAPESTPVTFILTRDRLVTLRYAEPWSFRTFSTRAPKSGCTLSDQVFVALMDTTVERLADMLELVTLELDNLTGQVFRRADEINDQSLKKVLLKIGACGNILSKVRESLIDKNRVLTFVNQSGGDLLTASCQGRVKGLLHDVQTLSDHATFMSSKVQFLLDATLGLINIEQNRIFKFFTIISVIFMPLNIIASMGGMSEFTHFAVEQGHVPFWLAYLLFTLAMIVIAWSTWMFIAWFGPGSGRPFRLRRR